MNSAVVCHKCGMLAAYSTLGHLFEINCSHCGYEEAGTFIPSSLDMPVAQTACLKINLGEAKPTAANLMWLSKLHTQFAALTPHELKAVFTADSMLELGNLSAEEVELIKKKCAVMGFYVFIAE